MPCLKKLVLNTKLNCSHLFFTFVSRYSLTGPGKLSKVHYLSKANVGNNYHTGN
jgi:hypothetical protein